MRRVTLTLRGSETVIIYPEAVAAVNCDEGTLTVQFYQDTSEHWVSDVYHFDDIFRYRSEPVREKMVEEVTETDETENCERRDS